jgi:hypothetical protein
MRSLARWVSVFLASVLMGAAASATATAEEGVARVSIGYARNQPMPRLVAPGEWLPHGCYLAVPYRGGSTLRFDRRETHYTLRIDGGPEQAAWISVSRSTGDLDVLKRELDRGSRGFAVICHIDQLASLPPLPAGRDIALTIIGNLPDFASLSKQRGVAALALYFKELEDLGPLAEFSAVTSLRLTRRGGTSDLRPLARLAKLTYVRLSGFNELTDLAPLAQAPALRGLEVWGCGKLSDLGSLAGARRLAMLKIRGSKDVSDLAPLAKLAKLNVLHLPRTGVSDLALLASLTELVELDLSGCKQVTDLGPLANLKRLERIHLGGCDGVKDLTPLREMIRRGGKVGVSKELTSQVKTLRG